MDRFSIILTLVVGPLLTGSLVIGVLLMGWDNWRALGGAAAIGFVLTWPISYAISRRIKRQDVEWDETKVERVPKGLPDPSRPEV